MARLGWMAYDGQRGGGDRNPSHRPGPGHRARRHQLPSTSRAGFSGAVPGTTEPGDRAFEEVLANPGSAAETHGPRSRRTSKWQMPGRPAHEREGLALGRSGPSSQPPSSSPSSSPSRFGSRSRPGRFPADRTAAPEFDLAGLDGLEVLPWLICAVTSSWSTSSPRGAWSAGTSTMTWWPPPTHSPTRMSPSCRSPTRRRRQNQFPTSPRQARSSSTRLSGRSRQPNRHRLRGVRDPGDLLHRSGGDSGGKDHRRGGCPDPRGDDRLHPQR